MPAQATAVLHAQQHTQVGYLGSSSTLLHTQLCRLQASHVPQPPQGLYPTNTHAALQTPQLSGCSQTPSHGAAHHYYATYC